MCGLFAARVAKLVDARDLKSLDRKVMPVQFRPRAPIGSEKGMSVNDPGNYKHTPAATTGSRLERWALLAEIVAAIAVVLSVAYLALQVSDNNRLLRSQAHYNGLELSQRPLELMIQNKDLAAELVKCDQNPELVTDSNWYQCNGYYLLQFNSWEYLYYQNEDGSIPTQLWVGADASFKHRIATRPGYKRFWSESQHAFDEPFRSYLANEFNKIE